MIYSYRDFGIGFFEKEYKKCSALKGVERNTCESKVRAQYRSVESGRFHDMADNTHRFMSALDRDEVSLFAKDSPSSLKIANEFGLIEDLRKFNKDGGE